MGDRARAKWAKKRGSAVPLSVGGARCPTNNVAWAKAYLCTKWYPDPSSHLATKGIGRKVGEAALPLSVAELGPHLTQCRLDRGLAGKGVKKVSVHTCVRSYIHNGGRDQLSSE